MGWSCMCTSPRPTLRRALAPGRVSWCPGRLAQRSSATRFVGACATCCATNCTASHPAPRWRSACCPKRPATLLTSWDSTCAPHSRGLAAQAGDDLVAKTAATPLPSADAQAPTVVMPTSRLGRVVAAPILAYRRWISPVLPPRCRFYPSCSEYALTAVAVHGPVRGVWLAVRRLLRCHPFHPGGIDYVPNPPRSNRSAEAA